MSNAYAYADAVARHFEGLRAELAETARVERLDWNAAIAKAQNEERAARQRHIEDVARDLRAEFRREVIELREEMGELFAQMHTTITAVSNACDAGDNALQRVIDARTADRV